MPALRPTRPHCQTGGRTLPHSSHKHWRSMRIMRETLDTSIQPKTAKSVLETEKTALKVIKTVGTFEKACGSVRYSQTARAGMWQRYYHC